MKVLELFAGTRSIGKVFEAKGHEVFSVEWDRNFENIDLYQDIGTITAEDILQKFGKPDVIWASPDCSTFSVAAISHHRRKNAETGNLDPISEYAKFCDEVDQHVLQLIDELNPQFKPPCKNGDSCHEKAPRGSRTGTQGLNGSKNRSVIPEALCKHIVEICEEYERRE